MIEVKLQFTSAAEAADALARMAGLIAPADRPDSGAPTGQLALPGVEDVRKAAQTLMVPPAVPAALAATVFGGAPTGAAVVPAAPPIPAPSTAAVAAPSTAPAAPPAISPVPTPAAAPSAPPPAPTAAAPAAPAAPANPAGVVLDKTGLPWDGRIHASTQATNADGTWRQKRGLNDEALRLRVEAELRAAVAAGAAPVAPPPAPAAAAAPVAPPPAPVVPAVPAAPAAPAVETFATLVARLTPALTSNPPRLTNDRVAAVLATLGGDPPITGLAQLAARPDLVVLAAPMFDQILAGA